jgi:hypothetical protein
MHNAVMLTADSMILPLTIVHENGAGNSPPWLRRGKGVVGLRAGSLTHHP